MAAVDAADVEAAQENWPRIVSPPLRPFGLKAGR